MFSIDLNEFMAIFKNLPTSQILNTDLCTLLGLLCANKTDRKIQHQKGVVLIIFNATCGILYAVSKTCITVTFNNQRKNNTLLNY